jgi:type II secretory pathway pseudopilin PulG
MKAVKSCLKMSAMVALTVAILGMVTVMAVPRVWADDADAQAKLLKQVERELRQLRADRARDHKTIQKLQQELDQVRSQDNEIHTSNQQLQTTTQKLQASNQQLQAKTDSELKQLQDQMAQGPSQRQISQALGSYWGNHSFTINGGAAGDFIYDHKLNQNTFSLLFEPIMLFRLNDWLAFEGTMEAAYDPGNGASFDAPVVTAQMFLNDYMEAVMGIFDQPFGDFYEDQGPVWVNRFITAPLPYGSAALVPPSDIGLQLRGGYQWGQLGQDVDYTVWMANGPTYDSSLPQPVVGQELDGSTNISLNTNGKAYGGRFRVYPFPLDSNLGRLELGASTYDGKWQNGLWLNSWGVDFAWHWKNLQTRGEWLSAYRQMPNGASPDNRQGWYLQAGYFLNGVRVPFLGDTLNNYISRLEPLIRYSGVNQRAVVTDEISTNPSFGFSGSPSVFAPHAREVALGLDYWIAPSIVWQTEVDFELPEAGGTSYTFNGASTPTVGGVGATPNDQAILTQFAVGF